MLILKLCHTLAKEKTAPRLQRLLFEQHLGHFRSDLRFGLAAIQDARVDVVAISLEHLLIRVEDCRVAHEEGLGDFVVALPPLSALPNLLGLVVRYEPILPLGFLTRLDDPLRLGSDFLLVRDSAQLLQALYLDIDALHWRPLEGSQILVGLAADLTMLDCSDFYYYFRPWCPFSFQNECERRFSVWKGRRFMFAGWAIAVYCRN